MTLNSIRCRDAVRHMSVNAGARAAHRTDSHGQRPLNAPDLQELQSRPISVDDVAFPGVWESDEELDEFLADLYASRPASMP